MGADGGRLTPPASASSQCERRWMEFNVHTQEFLI